MVGGGDILAAKPEKSKKEILELKRGEIVHQQAVDFQQIGFYYNVQDNMKR